MRTWMVELAVVATILLSVAWMSGGRWIEFVGAMAVTLTFAHAQVANRLEEAEARRMSKFEGMDRVRHSRLAQWVDDKQTEAVHCHRWATRYLVGKELLWLVYFIALNAWTALVGVGLFLAYPLWRRVWRAHHASA